MSSFTQTGRALKIETPLGADVLLLTAVKGREAVSSPFHFELEMLSATPHEVVFANVLGQPATVTLQPAGAPLRYLHGIVTRLIEGRQVRTAKGDAALVRYRAHLAPKFWLLTKRLQNRIFQQLTVPTILQQVLAGLEVRVQLMGAYQPRDYCVQYAESDFAFACRLMEEEGIGYFFEHGKDSHTLVVFDTAASFAKLPGQDRLILAPLDGGPSGERRVRDWEKQQDVVASQCTLRDHCFELHEQSLEYQQTLSGSVAVGTVEHPLLVGPANELTIADYPGGFAQRFDGITAAGAPQPERLKQIYVDGQRTVRIRMEREAAQSLQVQGTSDYSHLTPGYRFTLDGHFNGNGDYVLTAVEHDAQLGEVYLSGTDTGRAYHNRFACIPTGLTYRPQRLTPCPRMQGTQSATVVGPTGNQVFCDKYGRVKVQFRWDCQGQNNADSSCWLRVAQPWAGQGFGSFHLPRVGHEVVVAFEEGDPDRPIIIGSVHNSQNMPPYQLPEQATVTGLLSRSLNGSAANASELRFQDDVPGQEQVILHAEHDLRTNTENSRYETIGYEHHIAIGNNLSIQVGAAPAGDSSGSGGGGTVDVCGISFDVANGEWSKVAGVVNDVSLGNSFFLNVGGVEWVTVGTESDIWLGNYTYVVLATNINLVVAKSWNISYGGTSNYDFSWKSNEAADRLDTVVGTFETVVGGACSVQSTGGYQVFSDTFISLLVGDSGIGLTDLGITLSVGLVTAKITDAGITLSVGDSSIAITATSIVLTSATILQVEA